LPRPSAPLLEALSDRELELLQLVAGGSSNKEIADSLFITVGTVKKHLNNIFGKLDTKNRTEAVARARELGLVE
ncbi:MAG: response regulator transcription factor, partial [Anaerolineae bacterium]|nr:response regulator transcription factor [Anaerolineae bacterium]